MTRVATRRRPATCVARLRERLDGAPEPLPRPPLPPPWALAAGFAALVAAQVLRRASEPPVWDSLFLEDGEIFLGDALNASFPDPMLDSYLGYLHVVPRAIGELGSLVPIEQVPLAMALATTTIVAGLAIYVLLASAAWIASPVLRAVLAAAFVLAPVTAVAMNGTAAYIGWYLLYASFWAVLCPWTERRWVVASTAVALAAALSNPLCGLLLPLAAATALRVRQRAAWAVPGAMAGGLVAQFVLRSDDAYLFADFQPAEMPRLFAERVTSSLLGADRFLEDAFGGDLGSPFAWVSLAVVAAAVGLGLRRLTGRRRLLLGGCAALAVVFFCSALVTRGTGTLEPDRPWDLIGSRYVYLPILLLLTGLVAALDRAGPGGRTRRRELAAAAAVAAVVAVNVPLDHHSTRAERWTAALDDGRDFCEQLRPDLRRREVFVPTAPLPRRRARERWEVRVACSKLGR